MGGFMRGLACIAVAAACAGGGCSYQVQTATAPQLDVYSDYASKVPGKWALVVDADAYHAAVSPTGMSGALCVFHLDLASSFRDLAAQTFGSLAQVDALARPLPADGFASLGYAGEIEITGDGLRPRVTFAQGLLTATALADVSLDADLVVTDSRGMVLRTSATGTGEGSSEVVFGCGGATDALSQAEAAAMKDLLGKLAERFSNAPQVRSAAVADATTGMMADLPRQ